MTRGTGERGLDGSPGTSPSTRRRNKEPVVRVDHVVYLRPRERTKTSTENEVRDILKVTSTTTVRGVETLTQLTSSPTREKVRVYRFTSFEKVRTCKVYVNVGEEEHRYVRRKGILLFGVCLIRSRKYIIPDGRR